MNGDSPRQCRATPRRHELKLERSLSAFASANSATYSSTREARVHPAFSRTTPAP